MINVKLIRYFLLLISAILFITCRDECEIEKDCIEKALQQNDMVSYRGEEIGCRFFLTLHEYRNREYFLLNSHCADLITYPFDCDGTTLCENGENQDCRDYYTEAKYIGIIGIRLP